MTHPLPGEPDATPGGHSPDGSGYDTRDDRAYLGEATFRFGLSSVSAATSAAVATRYASTAMALLGANCGLRVRDRRSETGKSIPAVP